jgi:hypothetical protein
MQVFIKALGTGRMWTMEAGGNETVGELLDEISNQIGVNVDEVYHHGNTLPREQFPRDIDLWSCGIGMADPNLYLSERAVAALAAQAAAEDTTEEEAVEAAVEEASEEAQATAEAAVEEVAEVAAVEVAAAGESEAMEAAAQAAVQAVQVADATVQAAVQAVQVAQQSLLKAMSPQTLPPALPASDATKQLNDNSLLLRSLVAGQHHLEGACLAALHALSARLGRPWRCHWLYENVFELTLQGMSDCKAKHQQQTYYRQINNTAVMSFVCICTKKLLRCIENDWNSFYAL